MSEGTNTWAGSAVPLYGESEITQQTAATDILSITGASAQSGDFLVLQNSSGTELAYFESTGDLNLYKTDQTSFARLNLPILNSAPASAGLKKGDLWLAKGTTDMYRFAMCISTATGKVRYGSLFYLDTIGSASN